MSDTNETVLRSAVAAFNDPDNREGYFRLYSPDVVLHGYPRGLSGLEGVKSFYSELWESFPDARLTVEEVIDSEDRLAARYSLTGVQSKDFYGAPMTGARTNVDGIAWLRFRDGRAAEVWQVSATLDLLTRLTARAAKTPTRPSASAEAAAVRWDERHAEER